MADDDAAPQDRLPDTSDPFVLLGVARDADERTLRAAYAALTRRYRPEQAPDEFARIHDAFARAREMQQFARVAEEHRRHGDGIVDDAIANARSDGDVANARGDGDVANAGGAPVREGVRGATDGAEDDDGDGDDVSGSARATADGASIGASIEAERADDLLARAAVAEVPARDALVEELLAGNAFVAAVRRAPHLREAVLASGAITWRALAEARDRFAAITLWRGAWDRAYLAGDLDRAQAMLEDPRLVIDVAEDLELARAAMDRLIALAWKRAVTDELVDALRAAAEAHWEIISYLQRFDRELGLATRVAARPLPPVLSVLPGFLVAGRLRDFEHRRRFALDLRGRLGADPAGAVEAIRAYRVVEPHVTRSMVEVVGEYLPDMRTRLDHLPRARFEALTRGLVAAGTAPRRWTVLLAGLAAIVAAGLAAGVVGVAATGTLAVAGLLVGERRRYRREIRPPVARVIHAVPVRVDVVATWIRANPRLAGRLGWYDLAIENDPDLDLFSLLAAASAEEANVIERDVYET